MKTTIWDGTPGSGDDEDRVIEYAYNEEGQLWKVTSKGSTYGDQVTEYVYGVTAGTGEGQSRLASNDFVAEINYPTTSPDTDEVLFSYNVQGEVESRTDQIGTRHVYDRDARGRLEHDRATVLGSTSVDDTVRRISRTYDALDRTVTVTSYDSATAGSRSVLDQVEFGYGPWGVVEEYTQEPTGAIDSGSPVVEYEYSFPTDGSTALRRTAMTYPTSSGPEIRDEYAQGIDTSLGRVSQRVVEGGTTDPVLFSESHLGLSGLVEREYGDTGVKWTLVGTDGDNNDNYVGLDRFGRIDELVVGDGQDNVNHYLTEYNFLSAPVLEEDLVGNIYGVVWCYDQAWSYDDLGRLVGHDRGDYYQGTAQSYMHRECWTLDRVGNESAYYGDTSSSCDYDNGRDCEVNKSDEITSVTELSGGSGSPVYWDHDKTGSVTDRGTSDDLTYDAWNRLVEYAIDSTTWAEYRYNGLGQRIEDSYYAADGRYHLYSAEGEVIEDWDSDQQPPALVYWYASDTAGSIVVRADGETAADFEYQVPDARGNIVTRLDDSGDPVHRYIYLVHGTPSEVSLDWLSWSAVEEDLHLFRGQRYLSEIGHTDLGRRMADVEFGRFLQRGAAGSFGNRYVYPSGELIYGGIGVGTIVGERGSRNRCWPDEACYVTNCCLGIGGDNDPQQDGFELTVLCDGCDTDGPGSDPEACCAHEMKRAGFQEGLFLHDGPCGAITESSGPPKIEEPPLPEDETPPEHPPLQETPYYWILLQDRDRDVCCSCGYLTWGGDPSRFRLIPPHTAYIRRTVQCEKGKSIWDCCNEYWEGFDCRGGPKAWEGACEDMASIESLWSSDYIQIPMGKMKTGNPFRK